MYSPFAPEALSLWTSRKALLLFNPSPQVRNLETPGSCDLESGKISALGKAIYCFFVDVQVGCDVANRQCLIDFGGHGLALRSEYHTL